MIVNNKQTGRLSSYNEGSQFVSCRSQESAFFQRCALEMKLISGQKISIVKHVPLMGSLELKLKNCHIALGGSEAEIIHVIPVNNGPYEFGAEGERR